MPPTWTKSLFFSFPVIVILAAPSVRADRKAEVEEYLRQFDANPAKVMNQRVKKYTPSGAMVTKAETAFSNQDVKSGAYVPARDRYRKNFCKTHNGARVCLKDVAPGKAPIAENDDPSALVDNAGAVMRSLTQMEARKLMQAQLAESPWSDDYWGIYKGVAAARYADNTFPADEDWLTNHKYVLDTANTLMAIFNSANASSIDNLSPAEKYDLLIGDTQGTLTRAMWREGEQYYQNSGKVEAWMGICHGWSQAAYVLPRPAKAIVLFAADGKTKIRFYPADIKALGSLLWANTNSPSKFIGGRCDDKSPKTDSVGRVISQDCFDTNPGTWHLSVVNQIGIAKRSMVMDATYDYEVWNQPIYAYKYSYFNPQTKTEAASLQAAAVPVEAFTKDKFRKYRSPNARYVVGIAMDVTYVVETNPTHSLTDTEDDDARRVARYMYDLEVDANGNIFGGEWYTNVHPDFLWTPPKGARTASLGDQYITGAWDPKGPVPAQWRNPAIRAAGRGQPLAAVVETLFALSRLK